MALANIFGWNRQDKAQTSAAGGNGMGAADVHRKAGKRQERHEQG